MILDPEAVTVHGTVAYDRYGRPWEFHGEPVHPGMVWWRVDSDPPETLPGRLLDDVHGPITGGT